MNEIFKMNAGKMRRNLTYAEKVLWKILRNRKLNGYKFRRQYIIKPYIVDYVCLHKKLIVELDGQSHDYQIEYDHKRTAYLVSLGYRVLRITNAKLLSHDEDVIEIILQSLQE